MCDIEGRDINKIDVLEHCKSYRQENTLSDSNAGIGSPGV
jgi:hypothetical protein